MTFLKIIILVGGAQYCQEGITEHFWHLVVNWNITGNEDLLSRFLKVKCVFFFYKILSNLV